MDSSVSETGPNQEKLAGNLERVFTSTGYTLRSALMDAGYSAHKARQGWAAVPKRVVRMLAKRGLRYVELGEIDAETQEKIVRGRLVHNVLSGTDKAVMSAKALGSDRRVNMFTPDNQVGIIVLQQPQNVSETALDVPADLAENKE